MVVATHTLIRSEKLPTVDFLADKSVVEKMIVKACEEYGFFKLINHGIPHYIIAEMEQQSLEFFAKPSPEKLLSGPANPLGYGCKNIGFNGDMGEVEYLLLNALPLSILQTSKTISNHPSKFSSAVNSYIDAVRELACEILILMAKGLRVPDSSVFSKLIMGVDSDSLLRLNHYPSFCKDKDTSTSSFDGKIGFGEHSDPQILTILKSNDVGGLQICLDDGIWVPVPPDPSAFFVNVGDSLQAMTNGRFVSVRHRAVTNANKSRLSIAYFGAPPLKALITCPPEMITTNKPSIYRPFTWAEFKKATYSLRLGDSRLQLFHNLQRSNVASLV